MGATGSIWRQWIEVENIFDFPSILAFDRHKYLCVPELYLPPMFNLASGVK